MADLQLTVDIFNALGIPGDLAFDGPIRAGSYNLYSAAVPQYVGYAYTVVSGANPNPSQAAGNAGTAKVGGSGPFAGILVNPKEYPLRGTTAGGPLAASLVLPDYAIGDLLVMGEIFVDLPGPASIGDLVTYDPLTGALNTIAPAAVFVGSSSTTTLTVASVSAGIVAVGQQITGTGVTPGTFITALGTGLGGAGTYTINVSQTIGASTTLTATNPPPAAFSVTGSIAPGSTPATDPSVLTVSAVGSGQIRVGSQLFGTGIPDNTTVISFGTGVGGTGTYNVNTVNLTASSTTITGPANTLIPNCVVSRYTANSTGGVAVIKLTN
jgi:hypothetical protein